MAPSPPSLRALLAHAAAFLSQSRLLGPPLPSAAQPYDAHLQARLPLDNDDATAPATTPPYAPLSAAPQCPLHGPPSCRAARGAGVAAAAAAAAVQGGAADDGCCVVRTAVVLAQAWTGARVGVAREGGDGEGEDDEWLLRGLW